MKSVGLDLHEASFSLAVLNGHGQVEKHLTHHNQKTPNSNRSPKSPLTSRC